MLDKKINNYLEKYLIYIASILYKYNCSANFVTLIGAVVGFFCFFCIVESEFFLAFLFLLLNRFFDGIDGALARIDGASDLGAFYDIISDFVFYSLFPIGFIFNNIENAFSICFLLLSFVSTQSTFLASAWIIEKNKTLVKKNEKSFFYIGGITEGFETIIFFTLMLIFNDFVYLISYIFGLLCWITCVFRIYYIRKILLS
ncbi:MAG: CDP-alcohol phosphatidyltransferase family protein [Proteobacteria bacterium]|nr:CDP-alcohol phosphatidyltransferase family protein [Pseudomonadota bacterium]